jgi:tRNA A37 threonylcarbamoyladenosine synthetase subunit TsaC/SUA5/YrdC
LAGETRVDQYTCSGNGNTNLNAQLIEEPTEESTVAKKEKSFPTAVVVGLGALIMVLSAVTGLICLRGREKTNTSVVQEEAQVE